MRLVFEKRLGRDPVLNGLRNRNAFPSGRGNTMKSGARATSEAVVQNRLTTREQANMNDQHVIAVATIVQVLLLLVNAVLIFWYLWETLKLRRAAEDQVTKSQGQVSAAHQQLEVMQQAVGNRSGSARSAEQTCADGDWEGQLAPDPERWQWAREGPEPDRTAGFGAGQNNLRNARQRFLSCTRPDAGHRGERRLDRTNQRRRRGVALRESFWEEVRFNDRV